MNNKTKIKVDPDFAEVKGFTMYHQNTDLAYPSITVSFGDVKYDHRGEFTLMTIGGYCDMAYLVAGDLSAIESNKRVVRRCYSIEVARINGPLRRLFRNIMGRLT